MMRLLVMVLDLVVAIHLLIHVQTHVLSPAMVQVLVETVSGVLLIVSVTVLRAAKTSFFIKIKTGLYSFIIALF